MAIMDAAAEPSIGHVCGEIAKDMRDDAANFDGKPFNGRTVAEYFGNHGAAIAALANICSRQEQRIAELERQIAILLPDLR